VCLHLSQVEAMAPMAKLLKQHPRTKASKERALATRRHRWVWHADRRYCQVCGIAPRFTEVSSYRWACPGRVPGHEQVHATHSMRYTTFATTGLPLVFCKLCGCYGQTRFAKLRLPCRGRPTTATATMHKRLMKGLHPLTQVPLQPHVAWTCPPPSSPRGQQVCRTRRSLTADQVLHRSASAATQVEGLEQQLDDLAGLERGCVQAAQAADDSSDEDVFALGFALDEH
jgi:hypothetical protein